MIPGNRGASLFNCSISWLPDISGKPLAGHFPSFCYDRLVNLGGFGRGGFLACGRKREIVAATRVFNSGGKFMAGLDSILAAMLAAKQSDLPVSNIRL